MNDTTGIRLFYTAQRASNTPLSSASRFAGFCVMIGTNWGSQLVAELGTSNLYVRGKYDGVWSSWRTV